MSSWNGKLNGSWQRFMSVKRLNPLAFPRITLAGRRTGLIDRDSWVVVMPGNINRLPRLPWNGLALCHFQSVGVIRGQCQVARVPITRLRCFVAKFITARRRRVWTKVVSSRNGKLNVSWERFMSVKRLNPLTFPKITLAGHRTGLIDRDSW
jgi:hypothetical protein